MFSFANHGSKHRLCEIVFPTLLYTRANRHRNRRKCSSKWPRKYRWCSIETRTNFDVQTGLWNFKALSSHQPKDMMSDELRKYTRMRNWGAMSDGCTMQLKPKPKDEDGNLKMCECGAGYTEETTHSFGYSHIVHKSWSYTMQILQTTLQRWQLWIKFPYISRDNRNCCFMLSFGHWTKLTS